MNALWDKFYLNKYDSNPHPGMIKAFNETMTQAIVLLPPSALEHAQTLNFDTNLQQFQAQTDMLGLFVSTGDGLFPTLTSRFDRFGANESD